MSSRLCQLSYYPAILKTLKARQFLDLAFIYSFSFKTQFSSKKQLLHNYSTIIPQLSHNYSTIIPQLLHNYYTIIQHIPRKRVNKEHTHDCIVYRITNNTPILETSCRKHNCTYRALFKIFCVSN